jgi:hypothetical protein
MKIATGVTISSNLGLNRDDLSPVNDMGNRIEVIAREKKTVLNDGRSRSFFLVGRSRYLVTRYPSLVNLEGFSVGCSHDAFQFRPRPSRILGFVCICVSSGSSMARCVCESCKLIFFLCLICTKYGLGIRWTA